MNLLGWTIRPVRRYQRQTDNEETTYWGAARHIRGDHHTLYLGKVENTSTEDGLRRELARRLREVLVQKGLPVG